MGADREIERREGGVKRQHSGTVRCLVVLPGLIGKTIFTKLLQRDEG